MNLRAVMPIFMLVSATAQASPWTFAGEAALGYDDNVANARQGGDAREAAFAELDASLEKTWDLDDDNALQTRFGVDTQGFTTYHGLDNAKASAQLRYLLRPGQAFYAPLVAVSASAAWWEFDSRLRDSADYRASAFLREQITTRISARVTGALDWREARSDVFDLRTRSLGVDLDWALSNRLAIYAGFQRRWGQFVTTRPGAPIYAPGTVYADDDAFDGEDALRLDGAADIAIGGFNFALAQWLSLDVQGTYVDAGANIGVHYRRVQSVASLLARF